MGLESVRQTNLFPVRCFSSGRLTPAADRKREQLCVYFQGRPRSVTRADLKLLCSSNWLQLMVLLSQFSEGCDIRCIPRCLTSTELEITTFGWVLIVLLVYKGRL